MPGGDRDCGRGFSLGAPQMRALRQHVLPELLRAAEQGDRRLRVWSAGCSTGEEPYSVAMMLRELLPGTTTRDVKVLATDVSETALAAARAGVYGPRAVQHATRDRLARFFVALPEGRYEVRPEVRDLVELSCHDLLRDAPPCPDLDLVLCRGVTSCFDRDTTRALMGRLHAGLRDGGYLLVGHSETLWRVSEDFRLVALGSGSGAVYVYRRLSEPVADRRAVLPDRRTLQELPLLEDRRRAARRSAEL